MKKLLGMIVCTMAIIISFTACGPAQEEKKNNNSLIEQNNENKEEIPVETTPINTLFEFDDAFKKINEVIELDETTKLSDEEIIEKYNLGKYDKLQKEVRSKVTDNEIVEVALIKLGDSNQSLDLFMAINKRFNYLKDKYKDNENITAILGKQENMVLKQQGGIVIYIISENAKDIEEKLQTSF